jgi:hypothetical protein
VVDGAAMVRQAAALTRALGAGVSAAGEGRRAERLLPPLLAAIAAATIAVGLAARAAGVDWGAPAQPLVLFLRPALSPWAAVGVAALGATLLAARRLLAAELGVAAHGAALFALTLVARLGLNMVRGGPHAWYDVFVVHATGQGRTEYLPALPVLHAEGVGRFLERFDALVPTLSVHAAGHPPGLLLVLDLFGIESAQGMAALTIGVGALATPALYLLARRIFDEPQARAAALLFVFVPTSLLYGATSADALYATLGVCAAALLVTGGARTLLPGAAVLAASTFFSYALLGVAAWAGLVRWFREGFVSALRMGLVCAAALLALYLALAAVTGFDVLAVVQATNDRYREGIAHVRPYLFYLFGSPAAFLVMLGPVAWFAARSLGRREETALALATVIAVAAVVGYTKAETERIWLFLVPFACLAAARSLRARTVPTVLVALAGQALVFEVLFATKW